MDSGSEFRALCNLVLQEKIAPEEASRLFKWTPPAQFNWVNDYFDAMARDNHSSGLRLVRDVGCDQTASFAHLAQRSHQVANFLASQGLRSGDRILMMLGNVMALWEIMLASMRLGTVIIPTATLTPREELEDRLTRGQVRAIIAERQHTTRFDGLSPRAIRICVDGAGEGWSDYGQSTSCAMLSPPIATASDTLLLLYFTSGTTAKPKLVAHTHSSYPVGHLSTAYWIGLKRSDVHLNLSSPGWAKHAWSCFFAPWNAEATVLAYQFERFSATALLDQLVRHKVTSLCAPPTVWRLMIQQDLRRWPVSLREVVSAGEPLNPEVIDQVKNAWGLIIRDGFGQTETTAQIGNPPGAVLKPGSMGRPLPGFEVVLIDADGQAADEGEICLPLEPRPVGLMREYLDDPEKTAEVMRDGYYHTGDIAARDADGYLTFVGRADDVFKSSDYRISPFELESILLEHPAIAEAAVVPSPDSLRLSVPKAYVTLCANSLPDRSTARSIVKFLRTRVSPSKRVRRVEFCVLPKTASGKIRRAELRQCEQSRSSPLVRREQEYWEEDFADLN